MTEVIMASAGNLLTQVVDNKYLI